MDYQKRGRPEGGLNSNGGFKKARQETGSISTGVGSKSKPCTKYFSIAGCPYGEGCHYVHNVPGGYNVVAQIMNLEPALGPRNMAPPQLMQNETSAPASRLRKQSMCKKYNTAEGCRFGDKCHFAHAEWELAKPPFNPRLEDMRPNHMPGRMEPTLPGPAATFGATATAKISVDASLAGAIIGKGGVNSKQICRLTGAKLSIRDHEADPKLRNIELEGSFEQIKDASAMVGEFIRNLELSGPAKQAVSYGGSTFPATNYKTKMCQNFSKGSCTFGERCHFAHGSQELREVGM